MQVEIKNIKIKKRIRKDMGNLEDLKVSLERFGLLQPITLNSNYELVAGHRRLEAAKLLGWETIEANFIDTKDKLTLLELELEENNQRKPFTDTELLQGYKELEKLRNPNLFAKLKMKFKALLEKHFNEKEERKSNRIIKNGFLSLICLLGIAIITLGAVLYTHHFITIPLHTIFDITGFIVFVIGGFYFAKFIIGIKSRKK